jgi:hypothetical protein
MCEVRPGSAHGPEQNEDRNPLVERHVPCFPAVAAMPAKGSSLETCRLLGEQKAEL